MGFVMGLLSRTVRKQARNLGVSHWFRFMRANGAQRRGLASLYDSGYLDQRRGTGKGSELVRIREVVLAAQA